MRRRQQSPPPSIPPSLSLSLGWSIVLSRRMYLHYRRGCQNKLYNPAPITGCQITDAGEEETCICERLGFPPMPPLSPLLPLPFLSSSLSPPASALPHLAIPYLVSSLVFLLSVQPLEAIFCIIWVIFYTYRRLM